jgi:hypothetical protein
MLVAIAHLNKQSLFEALSHFLHGLLLFLLEKNTYKNWAWWLMPVIPTTREAEIAKIIIQDQTEQKVRETPIPTKKKLGIVVCSVIPTTREV